MCIKNIKYMQSHLMKVLICLHSRRPGIKRARAEKKKNGRRLFTCSFITAKKIRSNYIWQPALYLNLIMSFCIQSNKGPAECYNENVYYHPLNESPRCPFLQMSALSRAFQKPAINAQSALGNVQKWSLWASSRLELMSDIVAFKKSFWSLNAAR